MEDWKKSTIAAFWDPKHIFPYHFWSIRSSIRYNCVVPCKTFNYLELLEILGKYWKILIFKIWDFGGIFKIKMSTEYSSIVLWGKFDTRLWQRGISENIYFSMFIGKEVIVWQWTKKKSKCYMKSFFKCSYKHLKRPWKGTWTGLTEFSNICDRCS